ncbi:hypothetical protein JCM16303_006476 [Sporobolomyces ruberrimus]
MSNSVSGTPPRHEPTRPDPPSSSRKRRRVELDASSSNPPARSTRSTRSATRTEPSSNGATIQPRPAKRNKQEAEIESGLDMNRVAPSEAPAPRGDPTKSADNSSDTMADPSNDHARQGVEAAPTEETSPLDSLSAEERRRLKGKGKAPQDEDELARVNRELTYKNTLIASQAALLSNIRSTVACTVCLETLEKPYALACGHVFCRKCLLEWFFRPDSSAAGGGNDDTSVSSSTSSDTDTSSDSSSSSSSGSGSGSGSTSSSYVGGSLHGQAFRVRNAGNSQTSFTAMANGLFTAALGRSPAEIAGGTRVTGTTLGRNREPPRITQAESESEDDSKNHTRKSLDADEVRKARLARFGGAGGGATGDSSYASPRLPAPAPIDVPRDPPTAGAPSSSPPPGAAALPPRAPPRSPTPIPPRPPLVLPKGQHRIQNLVCPQCRTPCSERSPHRIFVLSELLSLVRTAEETGLLHSVNTPPPPRVSSSEEAAATVRTDLPGLEETDSTWGGLFPGVGGTESAKDKRMRLAQVVRDRDDGVRRCGECNWEIDERSGTCEGCGRRWDMSETDGDGHDSEDDDGRARIDLPFTRHDSRQRPLARHHHALEDSERSDDSESAESREDEYESDDFLVKSDEEEGEGGPAGRRRPGSGATSEVVIWSDDDESEVERKREQREAGRRRARRQEGERIDLDSDTDEELDGSSHSGSDSGSSDSPGSVDPVPASRRTRVGSSSAPSTDSSAVEEDDDEVEILAPARRKKRVIEAESEESE